MVEAFFNQGSEPIFFLNPGPPAKRGPDNGNTYTVISTYIKIISPKAVIVYPID